MSEIIGTIFDHFSTCLAILLLSWMMRESRVAGLMYDKVVSVGLIPKVK